MNRRAATLLAALVLTVGACGDGGGSDVESAGAGSAVVRADDGTETTTPETTSTTEQAESSTSESSPTERPSPYLIDQLGGANRGAETSQLATETGQLPVRTLERFQLAAGDAVAGIEWLGVYSFCQERDGVPEPHATGFVVEIYRDGPDGPKLEAEPVYATTFDVDETNETFDDTFDQPCQNRPESTWAFYRYEVTLAEPFVADGDPYWLLIQAVTPGFDTYWAWQSAAGPASLQEFNGEIRSVTTGARAYALRTIESGQAGLAGDSTDSE